MKYDQAEETRACYCYHDHHHTPPAAVVRRHNMIMVEDPVERVVRLAAAESAVVIFSVSTCCMCHAMKRLFCGMGVSPAVYELDQHPMGKEIERVLVRLLLGSSSKCNSPSPSPLPVVFIGGKLVGAMDRLMASHINGTLVPLLKQAGALWL